MSTHETLVGKRPQNDHHGKGRARFWVIVIVLIMVARAVIGIIIRMISHAHLNQRTQAESMPTVSVVKPTIGPGEDDVTLPGNLQAFVDAPLYARTDGYLKAWYFDIGAKVKKGQLIAVIETPELDQQLDQAKAALASAEANYDIAVVTNTRYQNLVKTAAVSKQEADQTAATAAAQKAAVDSAAANVKHYEALQSFEKITAPFDGVVTEPQYRCRSIGNIGYRHWWRLRHRHHQPRTFPRGLHRQTAHLCRRAAEPVTLCYRRRDCRHSSG